MRPSPNFPMNDNELLIVKRWKSELMTMLQCKYVMSNLFLDIFINFRSQYITNNRMPPVSCDLY